MEMTPLTLVVLLAFGLLIAVCLTAWTALSFERQPPEGAADAAASSRRKSARLISNDEVRGARGRGEKPAGRGSDEPSRERPPTAGSWPGADARPAPEQSGGSWRSATAVRVTSSRAAEKVADDSSKSRKQPSEPDRSVVTPKQEHDEDAFERFLRVRPDDIDIR